MNDYEVELKFSLPDEDPIVDRLTARGAQPSEPVRQVDLYFSHPVRDFAHTDEALRLRTVGGENTLTYKGPLLDRSTKTRQEIELQISDGSDAAERAWAILRALGFEDVRRVIKVRQPLQLTWEGRSFALAVDDVEGLGRFVEIETLAGPSDWQAARDAALRLAQDLNLQQSERRSYLQLLLDRPSGTRWAGTGQ